MSRSLLEISFSICRSCSCCATLKSSNCKWKPNGDTSECCLVKESLNINCQFAYISRPWECVSHAIEIEWIANCETFTYTRSYLAPGNGAEMEIRFVSLRIGRDSVTEAIFYFFPNSISESFESMHCFNNSPTIPQYFLTRHRYIMEVYYWLHPRREKL